MQRRIAIKERLAVLKVIQKYTGRIPGILLG